MAPTRTPTQPGGAVHDSAGSASARTEASAEHGSAPVSNKGNGTSQVVTPRTAPSRGERSAEGEAAKPPRPKPQRTSRRTATASRSASKAAPKTGPKASAKTSRTKARSRAGASGSPRGGMERRLADWGRKLDELKTRVATVGDAKLSELSRELEDKFRALRSEIEDLAGTARAKTTTRSRGAGQSGSDKIGTAKIRAQRTWKDTKAVGKEIGTGLRKAWGEMKTAFGRAKTEYSKRRK